MPVLPPELECLIVKLALRNKSVEFATRQALSNVARRFRIWVDEVPVHETILIDSSDAADSFLDNAKKGILNPKDVKFLCITHGIPFEDAASIVEMCTQVTALALWSICRDSTTLFAALSHLQLWLLSIELSQLNTQKCTITEAHIVGVLDACPTLQVVVVLTYSRYESRLPFAVDNRVVVLPTVDGVLKEWHAKVDGEENVWTVAEKVIAERGKAQGVFS
uniref:F-box domain-containing protein n=1 Tax=Mycena chlorophos TaxID=658473 RepID=A0ABQ0L1I3_MYCCL|nr:predicted protein [Mycena chlorophos]